MTEELHPIKIVAVVKMNNAEAWVLNRMPELLYEKTEHGGLIAHDGPFSGAYSYSAPSAYSKAFAGHVFKIPMKDGTFTDASGQWWHAGIRGQTSIALSTEEKLNSCYVFFAGSVDMGKAADLRAAYTGPIYGYTDHKKLLKHDKLWSDYVELKFGRDKKVAHLTASVKRHAAEARTLAAKLHEKELELQALLPQQGNK